MSENSLWKWLDGKMKGHWKSRRIEKCSVKGIPDTVVKVRNDSGPIFIELKDWSGDKRHPLLREQYNFLNDIGGKVVIKFKDSIYVMGHEQELSPLLDSDISYVISYGEYVDTKNFDPSEFIQILCPRW